MWWVIGILVLVALVGGMHGNKLKTSKEEAYDGIKTNGFEIESKTEICKYIAGHPELDNSVANIVLMKKENLLYLVKEKLEVDKWKFFEVASIPIENIKDLAVEDSTTIEKKVTAGRILALGLFAFAAKKKVTNHLAYLTISWNDGKFNHDTIFEYDGQGAIQLANKSRNSLIRICKSDNKS